MAGVYARASPGLRYGSAEREHRAYRIRPDSRSTKISTSATAL